MRHVRWHGWDDLIGQATAPLYPPARRLLQRCWGTPNIDTRQKWVAVWPWLARLPQAGLRILDAGCGDGDWALEIALRRPRWSIVGIDRDEGCIATAAAAAATLARGDVRFEPADFLTYETVEGYDVVLSVASSHYAVESASGGALFRAFARWLKPGGTLVLYAPRRTIDVPAVGRLPPPFAPRDVLSAEDLQILSKFAGLEIEQLRGAVGSAGTLAKQIARAAGEGVAARAVAYPLEVLLTGVDRMACGLRAPRRSAYLLLIAHRPGAGAGGPVGA